MLSAVHARTVCVTLLICYTIPRVPVPVPVPVVVVVVVVVLDEGAPFSFPRVDVLIRKLYTIKYPFRRR